MYPEDLRYTKDHEWARKEGDGTWTVGITDFAQKQLGEVVFVELPRVGATFEATDSFGTVESVKAVSELYAPMACNVTAVNADLNDDPELVNSDPYGDGWYIKVKPSSASAHDSLMTAADYEAYLRDEGG